MRDIFTDLINKGVACPKYINHVKNGCDPIDDVCRLYNNIFGMPTDTRMTITADDRRVITGHMVSTLNWDKFICAPFWGAIDFKLSGYRCLLDFLNKYKLTLGENTVLNGDIVATIVPVEECECECPCDPCDWCYVTCESKIPKNIVDITTDKNINHIAECLKNVGSINDFSKNLNESSFIKGTNWYQVNDSVYGIFNDDIIILKKK